MLVAGIAKIRNLNRGIRKFYNLFNNDNLRQALRLASRPGKALAQQAGLIHRTQSLIQAAVVQALCKHRVDFATSQAIAHQLLSLRQGRLQ